jgi:hypothetical protein
MTNLSDDPSGWTLALYQKGRHEPNAEHTGGPTGNYLTQIRIAVSGSEIHSVAR